MLLELITPANCCQVGMAMLSGEMPPPLSTQPVSDFQAPPAPAVTKSVPPTETMLASSAGHASLADDHVELSPDAAKNVCPCAAIFWKYGSSVSGSAGVQPHEQPMLVGSGLCVVIAPIMAVSVFPTYTTKLANPGAIPNACVISRVCSESSQPLLCKQLVSEPSVENSVMGTLFVWPMFL